MPLFYRHTLLHSLTQRKPGFLEGVGCCQSIKHVCLLSWHLYVAQELGTCEGLFFPGTLPRPILWAGVCEHVGARSWPSYPACCIGLWVGGQAAPGCCHLPGVGFLAQQLGCDTHTHVTMSCWTHQEWLSYARDLWEMRTTGGPTKAVLPCRELGDGWESPWLE